MFSKHMHHKEKKTLRREAREKLHVKARSEEGKSLSAGQHYFAAPSMSKFESYATMTDLALGVLMILQLLTGAKTFIIFLGPMLHWVFCSILGILDIIGLLHSGDDADDNATRYGTARWRVISDYFYDVNLSVIVGIGLNVGLMFVVTKAFDLPILVEYFSSLLLSAMYVAASFADMGNVTFLFWPLFVFAIAYPWSEASDDDDDKNASFSETFTPTPAPSDSGGYDDIEVRAVKRPGPLS
jgi:hypothetical protein